MLIAIVSAAPALADNVALNKTVSVVAGSESLLSATAAGVVTDGAFLTEATAYSAPSAIAGAVRWNSGAGGPVTLEIDLGGLCTIDGIIAQADDNDSLLISYLDSNNTYQPLYNVAYASTGWGFVTRPSGDQVTFAPLTPVNTTKIRITETGGDGFYGISELQLRGVAIPAPAPVAAIIASGALALRRRRA
jgi:hypothetical protein